MGNKIFCKSKAGFCIYCWHLPRLTSNNDVKFNRVTLLPFSVLMLSLLQVGTLLGLVDAELVSLT